MSGWEKLGTFDPDRLAAARDMAHWAAQVISAAGETYLEHLPDTSHTNMEWVDARRAFLGAPIDGVHDATRVGVRIEDLTLLLVDASGSVREELALPGHSLQSAYDWTAQRLGGVALAHPGYELPPHLIAEGGTFADTDGLSELARWFANADPVLRGIEAASDGASPVRCWPHHFDLATPLVVRTDAKGEATATVGVGLSPGDTRLRAPYWYVNSWPTPDRPALPPLVAGRWHTDGWIGAVLEADELVALDAPEAQEAHLRRFLESAVAGNRRLLGD